jgi:SRSO17 transposase
VRSGRRRDRRTGQAKAAELTVGIKRQYLGCVGKAASVTNTVHPAYAREGAGHALIGAGIDPGEHLDLRLCLSPLR